MISFIISEVCLPPTKRATTMDNGSPPPRVAASGEKRHRCNSPLQGLPSLVSNEKATAYSASTLVRASALQLSARGSSCRQYLLETFPRKCCLRCCQVEPHVCAYVVAIVEIVHQPDNGLGCNVTLVSQRTHKPHGGRKVASCIRSITILQRPCRQLRSKAQNQKDGGDGVLQREIHGLRPSPLMPN